MNDERQNSRRGFATTSEEGPPYQEPNGAEVVNGNEDEMPTLAAKLFIESVTEVELLKKFRLVNKFWNHEACHALRKLSITTLTNRNSDLEDFHSMLNSGAMTSLPFPFQQVSLRVHGKLTKDFFTSIHPFGLEIKSLLLHCYTLSDDVTGLLKMNSKDIAELNIRNDTKLENVIENFSQVRFPSLQTLEVSSHYREHEKEFNSAEFVQILLKQGSPLTSLTITIYTSSCFSSLLNLNLTRITTLSMCIYVTADLPKECWDALATVQLPALKMFNIEADIKNHGDPFEYLQQLNSFLNNVTLSLESLSVKLDFFDHNSHISASLYELGNTNMIIFPNLKRLEILDLTPAEQIGITHEKFPCLEEVQIQYPDREDAQWLKPTYVVHPGVQKISIGNGGNVDLDYDKIKASVWVNNLIKQFPNVTAVEILMCTWRKRLSPWTSFCLRKLYYSYPQLKSLKLDIKTIMRTERVFCIPHFQNLESLELGDGEDYKVELSDWSIQNIILRFPKLKYLRFSWSRKLSVEVVRDSLQHLHVLEIFNFMNWRNTLTQLRAAMPGTLVKARYRGNH